MLWLLGCLYISDDELAQAVAEREVGQGALELSELSPKLGLTSGGEEIELTGRGFNDEVEVRFGSASAEVLSVEPTRVYVRAPAASDTGSVDVSVIRGSESSSYPDSYTYFADGEGLIGVTGTNWYFQRRGGYWAGSEQDMASMSLRFIEPRERYEYWQGWASELDACTSNPPSLPTSVPYDLGAVDPDVVATLTTSGGLYPLELKWSPSYVGFQADVPPATIITSGTYKVLPVQVEGYPEFAVNELYNTPAGWEVLTPPIDGARVEEVDLSQLSVTWSGSGGAVATLMQVGLINPSSGGFESELYCALEDDGRFDVPPELTADWPPGREVHLLVGRYLPSNGTVEFNGGGSLVPFVDWRYGALSSR